MFAKPCKDCPCSSAVEIKMLHIIIGILLKKMCIDIILLKGVREEKYPTVSVAHVAMETLGCPSGDPIFW
jgi:hypothetical protein